MRQKIAVLDYGMGNLHSVAKALAHVAAENHAKLHCDIQVTDQPEKIMDADKIIFPGVGAIRDCMSELKMRGLDQVLYEVMTTKPLLAICVGMQALLEQSEENGGVACLSVLPGKIKRFDPQLTENNKLIKVPHMGWNQVKQKQSHPLWQGIADQSRFYFVHSYHAVKVLPEQVVGETHYGENFAVSLAKDNIFAVQFHPEKSQHNGLQLLANFLAWNI